VTSLSNPFPIPKSNTTLQMRSFALRQAPFAALICISSEVQAEVLRLHNFYRESGEIAAITEKEFQPFDELIERSPEKSRMLLAILEKWNHEKNRISPVPLPVRTGIGRFSVVL
jgi:hypothetical protein